MHPSQMMSSPAAQMLLKVRSDVAGYKVCLFTQSHRGTTRKIFTWTDKTFNKSQRLICVHKYGTYHNMRYSIKSKDILKWAKSTLRSDMPLNETMAKNCLLNIADSLFKI